MKDVWDKIPQMHRTILFEEFTHPASTDAKNFFDLLSTVDSEVELFKAIRDHLEVRSFADFLKKFRPKVYEYAMGSGDGSQWQLCYTVNPMEAQRHKYREIDITSESYYEMLVGMYTQKGRNGVANIEFNDEKLREILTPKRNIEKLYDMRRQIPLLMELHEEKVRKHENAAPIDKQLKEIRRSAVEQINRPTSIWAIGLDDAVRQIDEIDKKFSSALISGTVDETPKALVSGHGDFDENGRWILIPAKSSASDTDENTDSPVNPQGDNRQKFALVVRNDLNKRAADTNEFTRNLVVAAYTGVDRDNPLDRMDSAELVEYRNRLVERKDTLKNLFKQAKESFIQALSENVQKLLSVKIFFDHATGSSNSEAKLPKGAGLIVANCTAAKLLGIEDKFKRVMQQFSNDTGKEKIWFAIMPHVLDSDNAGNFDATGSWDSDDLEDEDDVAIDKSSLNVTDFESATTLLKIMEECKILTVFNFAPTEKTTFSALSDDTVNGLQEKLERRIDYEHAVYALPNFTIMQSGTVPINDEPGAPEIPVPAMYIDASYVAAGLLVAAQQPEFWLNQGFQDGVNFTKRNPCVRIDFEAEEVTAALQTKFNRERSIDWNPDVIGALTGKRFGFAFDGDRRYDRRTESFISNTYILNARTLKQRDGKYQQIFRTLTKDFIETYLRVFSITRLSSLKNFIKTDVNNDWKREAAKTPESINLLLRDGEDIIQDGNDLKVKFLDGEDTIKFNVTDD